MARFFSKLILWQIIVVLFLATTLYSQAQEEGASGDAPKVFIWQSIMRSLNVDFYYGFNLMEGAADSLETNFWTSSSWQISLRYKYVFAKDLLAIYAGVSIGEQWLDWRDESRYLEHVTQTRFTSVEGAGIPLSTLSRNVFSTLQLGIPILFEIRPTKGRERSLRIAVGGYAQYLSILRSSLVYEVDGFTERRTIVSPYDVNRFQFGVEGRLGWRFLFVSYSHALQPYFERESLFGPNLRIHSITIGLTSFY